MPTFLHLSASNTTRTHFSLCICFCFCFGFCFTSNTDKFADDISAFNIFVLYLLIFIYLCDWLCLWLGSQRKFSRMTLDSVCSVWHVDFRIGLWDRPLIQWRFRSIANNYNAEQYSGIVWISTYRSAHAHTHPRPYVIHSWQYASDCQSRIQPFGEYAASGRLKRRQIEGQQLRAMTIRI